MVLTGKKKEIVIIIARPPGSMWTDPDKLFLGTQTQRSYAIIVPNNETFEGRKKKEFYKLPILNTSFKNYVDFDSKYMSMEFSRPEYWSG